MIEIQRTEVFDTWFDRLRDRQARSRIMTRVDRLGLGNPGDSRSVGGGIFEMRIHYGPGYRVYYVRRGEMLIVLLAGGDKGAQDSDIRKALALAGEL